MSAAAATRLDIQQEEIRAALLTIVERNNGVLNPRHVVDAARAPDHPLHRHFEWDDTAAAEAYRLAQAGALIRQVKLTVIRSNPGTRALTLSTTRGFQSRPSMRRRDGGYEPVEAILSDPGKRSELLAQVLRELSAYRRRYDELSELQAVWFAIDEATIDLSPPAPGGETRPGAAG